MILQVTRWWLYSSMSLVFLTCSIRYENTSPEFSAILRKTKESFHLGGKMLKIIIPHWWELGKIKNTNTVNITIVIYDDGCTIWQHSWILYTITSRWSISWFNHNSNKIKNLLSFLQYFLISYDETIAYLLKRERDLLHWTKLTPSTTYTNFIEAIKEIKVIMTSDGPVENSIMLI